MNATTYYAIVLSEKINKTEFCKQKAILDAHLNVQAGGEIQCGAYVEVDETLPIKEYSHNELQQLLERDQNAKLVDIREPHEYLLQHGIEAQENVPITRLVEFIADHLADKDKHYVLVCRSGTRSLVVAQALRQTRVFTDRTCSWRLCINPLSSIDKPYHHHKLVWFISQPFLY